MRDSIQRKVACLAVTMLSCIAAMPGAAQEEVSNSDIYVTVTELGDEVELIREAMGRPFDDSPRLPVSGVNLFELYAQIETLLLRSNRLANELADAELMALPPLPASNVSAVDVLALAEAALGEIRRVRAELGVTEEVVREERGTPIAPTGVFSVVLDTNRQINLLLDRSVSSADVHERLVLASQLAAGIIDRLGAVAPAPAPMAAPRWPFHVFHNLLECLGRAHEIGRMSGVELLTVSARRNVPVDVTQGHVYDIAQFLVADLALLARHLDAEPVEIDLRPMPRHIFPVHTNALAEQILRQLEVISTSL